ncbi:inhibition of morphological differentiation protein [Williamsia sp. Leaf354]|uniref:HAD family hydrolase n=1 Tax=Williamsia sp. Leaf354 TaxID=1736349 RepID=UPI0006F7DB0F|nr:HAD-IB family hydrolase [Williamsia sp. Leaf354]KQS00936.1 inhibition of morphological differentiation protein [Williamsia sp. Leaf354]
MTPPGRDGVPRSAGAADTPVAAFFDLDKTIIAKSSTLAFSRPFFDEGLINRRAVLKSSYAQFLFLLTAADRDQVERLRRHVTQMCAGWDVDQVRGIVAETLHDIVDPLVFAEATDLIAGHRARGHDVVIVSASGSEIVEPIGEMLGVDTTVASRMEVVDGHYSGEVEFYCYGDGKVTAMEELAARRGYDLEACFAYSDSITDLPMLAAVGHPTAVNPDRQLRRAAATHGWPVLTFSRPVSLRERIPGAPSRGMLTGAAAVGVGAVVAGGLTYAALHKGRNR